MSQRIYSNSEIQEEASYAIKNISDAYLLLICKMDCNKYIFPSALKESGVVKITSIKHHIIKKHSFSR